MASMKSSTKSAQKASKKGGPSRKKASASSKPKKVDRILMSGSIPQSSMRISGSKDVWRVSGVEIIDKVRTSEMFVASSFNVNPLVNDLFPRLSGFALQFQRYRFSNITLRYYTACPATRSGAIGFAVSTQYMDPTEAPDSFPAIGSFEHGAVGTVATSFSTPVWRPKTDERFNLPASPADMMDDPFKVYQSTLLILTGDADSTDDGKNAGYLAIEYDVDLYGYRPTVDKMIAINPTTPQTFSSGQQLYALTGPSGLSTDHTSITSQVASWAIDQASSYFGDGGSTLGGVLGNLKSAFDYAANWVIPLAAALSLDKGDAWEDVKSPPPGLRVKTLEPRCTKYVNTKYVAKEVGVIPMDEKQCLPAKYLGRVPCPLYAPAAAGDIRLTIFAVDDFGNVTQLALYDYTSLGTSAVVLSARLVFVMPPGCKGLFLDVLPTTAGESRALNLGTDSSTIESNLFNLSSVGPVFQNGT